MSFGHVLIFGGTGMLSQATGWITEKASYTIVFGRNRQRLNRLREKYWQPGLEIQELDYTNIEALKSAIKTTYMQHGTINMVVAWIHSTAPDAIPTIMKQISELQKEEQWSLIVIKGSSDDLSRITTAGKNIPNNCNVKEVQLGFKFDGSVSRWLTHQEISEGVNQAIESDKIKTVVGTLEPWERRP